MALDILNFDHSAAIPNLFGPVLSESDIAFDSPETEEDAETRNSKPRRKQPEGQALIVRDRMVLDHLHLVKATASSIRKNLPVHAEYEDLVQAGIVGLIDAVNKFDSEKQNSFPTYAKHRIRGAILDYLRKLDWASRDMRRRQKLVAAAVDDLTASLERAPSENEIANKAGLDLKTCRNTMTDLRNGGPVSYSRFTNEQEERPLPEFASSLETRPDFICGRQELRGVLAEVLKTLPEKHRKVVVMYYANDMSMKEIGSALSINESRVSQIHKSALAKMAAVLEAHGIGSHQAFID
jgi:RNA polymerase sigma factor for flagellar operon FliA